MTKTSSALHAQIQTRGRSLGGERLKHRGGGAHVRRGRSTLINWVKAQSQGKLKGADSKPVSAEQMEISRLRAELARVKMERDILKKATAYFARESM